MESYYILELGHLHFQNPNTLYFRTKFVIALSHSILLGNPSELSLKCNLLTYKGGWEIASYAVAK